MKNLVAGLFFMGAICSTLVSFGQRFWISNVPSNWNNPANWSSTSGGPGGASVPNGSHSVTFNALGTGNCLIDVPDVEVNGISMIGYNAAIDLNGFVLTSTGTNTFASGYVMSMVPDAQLLLNTNGTTTFSGTAIVVNISGSTGRLFLNGSLFNNSISLTKTASENDVSSGGNIFAGPITITTTAGGITLGNSIADQYFNPVTFNNFGTHRIVFAGTSTTTFDMPVTLNANKSGGPDTWPFMIAEGANSSVVFQSDLSIICQGTLTSNFRFLNGLGSTATYNGNVFIDITNSSTSTVIYMGLNGTSLYNGNIVVENGNGGADVRFNSSGNASSILTSSGNIAIGADGFNSGELRMCRFTQQGNGAQTLALAGNAILTVGPSSEFGGDVSFTAPRLNLDGAIYHGSATFEKTGINNDTGDGGNIFNGDVTINNSGSGNLLTAFNAPDTFNGDLTANSTGSGIIGLAHNVAGNLFNGNIHLVCDNGAGIRISGNAGGTSTLAAGGSVTVGTFNSGQLQISRFTQTDASPVTLSLTGTNSILRLGPSTTFVGNTTFSSPSIYLDGVSFNGTVNSITKNGSGVNSSYGGNYFAPGSTTTISNTGTGTFRLANNQTDFFAGDVSFIQSSGTLQPAYNVISTFQGNVTVDNVSSMTFGTNTGGAAFTGSASQTINKTTSPSLTFRRFSIAKPENHVTLNTVLNISTLATFTSGNVLTSASNYLNFGNGVTVNGASSISHVDGPVRKTGNESFSFPTGNAGVYRPIAISAPTGAGSHFTARYFKALQNYGSASAPGIVTISGCEYWTLDRTNGASNVNVTLSWNVNDCTGEYVAEPANLRVLRWNGILWADHGNGGVTGTASAGTVISGGVVTSFSPFTLGSTTFSNPLPVEFLDFTAAAADDGVHLKWITASEISNDYFTVQRSADGVVFKDLGVVEASSTSEANKEYEFLDKTWPTKPTYYRVKQTDFDNTSSYSKIVAVKAQAIRNFLLHPNPASKSDVIFASRTGDLTIINDLGIVVLRVLDSNEIDASGLRPGVYTVKTDDGQVQRLLIK